MNWLFNQTFSQLVRLGSKIMVNKRAMYVLVTISIRSVRWLHGFRRAWPCGSVRNLRQKSVKLGLEVRDLGVFLADQDGSAASLLLKLLVQARNLALVWTKIRLGNFVSRICLLFQVFNPACNYSDFADQLTRLRLLQSLRQWLVSIDRDAHFFFVELF